MNEPEQVSEVKYFNVTHAAAGNVELIPAATNVRFKVLRMKVVSLSTTANNVYLHSDGEAVYADDDNPVPFDMNGDAGIPFITDESESIGVFQTRAYNQALYANQSAAQKMWYSGAYVEIRNGLVP